MGGLEDSFLKKNIPGRYSTWSHDDEPRIGATDGDSIGSEEDDEYYYQDLPPLHQATSTHSVPPKRTSKIGMNGNSSNNTGVKGVIADYEHARQEEQLKEAEDRLEKVKILSRATGQVRYQRENTNGHANDASNKKIITDNIDEDENDDCDEYDDDFLKKFRSQRIHQLRQTSQWPSFGTLSSLTPDEYVSFVDTIPSRVHLLVHLYDSTSKECNVLHSTLERLAQVMAFAKFVEVDYEEAAEVVGGSLRLENTRVCLPMVLVYRGGELVDTLVRVGSAGTGVEEVKELLENAGVLDPMSADFCR